MKNNTNLSCFLLIGTNLHGIYASLARAGRVLRLPTNATPEAALQLAPEIDVFCLCDPQLNPDGLNLLRELRLQQFYQPALVYAEQMSYEDIEKCLAVYVSGCCVVEDASPDILAAGLQMMLHGHFWMSPQCQWTMHLACYARYLLPNGFDEASNKPSGLSSRQIEMLDWISQGLSNKEIATRSGLSIKTVETHIQRLFKKLNVYSRTQAIATGVQCGYLPGRTE